MRMSKFIWNSMIFTCSVHHSSDSQASVSGVRSYIKVSNNSALPLLVSGVGFAKNKQPSTAADEKAVFAASFEGSFCLHAGSWLNTQELLAWSKQRWEEWHVWLPHWVDDSSELCRCSCDGGDASLCTYCRKGAESSTSGNLGQLPCQGTNKTREQQRCHAVNTCLKIPLETPL